MNVSAFDDILAQINLIEENMETRRKAADFKSKMKPVIKKMKHVDIGDARRYAYMLLWPFLRDELGIEDMQGQNTPSNSALIQRKLEDLSDAGLLPADAGDRFEKYALNEFDQFVGNRITLKPSHHEIDDYELNGHEPKQDLQTRASQLDASISNPDATPAEVERQETPTERAERKALEAKIAKEAEKAAKAAGSANPLDGLEEIQQSFRNAVTDLKDTLVAAPTSLIELFFKYEQGLVPKRFLTGLFKPEELADEIDYDKNKAVIELKPDAQLTKMIQTRGAEKVEQMITDIIQDKLRRDVRVVVHAPEEANSIGLGVEDEEDDIASLSDLSSDEPVMESYTSRYLPEGDYNGTHIAQKVVVNESKMSRDILKPKTMWQMY